MDTHPDPLPRPDSISGRVRGGGARAREVITGGRTLTTVSVLAILALGALLRVWAFGGLSFALGADDARYVAVAQNLAGGDLPNGEAEWFGARAVFLWPVALVFRVMGADDYRAVAWPFACSLLSILAAFLIGRELGGRRVGLVAAGIVAVAPVEVLWATRLRPDAVMPAFVALAAWAALRARESPRAAWWLAAAGALMGAAWSARETALVMLPVVIYAAWPALRPVAARAGAGLAGLAAIPLVVVVVFAADGRPMWPLTITADAGAFRSPIEGWGVTTSYVSQLVTHVLDPGSPLMLALPGVLIAGAVAVVRRRRAAILPAGWLILGFAYLEVGTLISVDKPVRFLTLLTVPAALLVAVALDGRLSPLIVPVVAVVTVLTVLPRNNSGHRGATVILLSAVASGMRDLPRAPILAADYTWWAKLNAYLPDGPLPVARAVDPAYLDTAGQRAARRLEPLPVVASYRGGYVVTGPVRETAGWPSNWDRVRRAIRDQVPWDDLEPVRRIGRATVWRWPA